MRLSIGEIKRKVNDAQTQGTSSGRLASLLLLAIAISATSMLLTMANILYTRALLSKPFPTLVQMADGSTVDTELKPDHYKSPEVIQSFVANTLYNLMTMTSYETGGQASALDPERPKAMPIKVGEGAKTGNITQSAWLASEALESKFADKFRLLLADMTPSDVFTGQEEIILKFDYVKEPVQLKDKNENLIPEWRVDVIGHLRVFRTERGEVRTIPFNKSVYVRTIEVPTILNADEYGAIAAALNKSLQSGLQITDIKDL